MCIRDRTKPELAEKFGKEVAELVDGLSKLDKMEFASYQEAQAENFRKMLMAMARDLRVVLIKLADRQHNLQTMASMRSDKRRRIALETLDIYAPIALRLGLNKDVYKRQEVHGNFYGTSKKWISDQLNVGADVLLEIDWQGAQQVCLLFSEAIGIFFLPPSMEELTRRLTGRGTDGIDVITRRLAAAQAEMRHVEEFDYVIVNDQLAQALEDLRAIVRASRLSLRAQRARHAALFARMF